MMIIAFAITLTSTTDSTQLRLFRSDRFRFGSAGIVSSRCAGPRMLRDIISPAITNVLLSPLQQLWGQADRKHGSPACFWFLISLLHLSIERWAHLMFPNLYSLLRIYSSWECLLNWIREPLNTYSNVLSRRASGSGNWQQVKMSKRYRITELVYWRSLSPPRKTRL